MPNTALNRTTQLLLTNKSGGAVVYGNVVIVDTTTDSSFTTTTTGGISTAQIGVVLEPNGIASNALGMVAVGGWAPRVTLNTAATRGQFIKSHSVAGQGTPHSSPQVEGDFAVALEASATPAVALFGSPNGPLAGGAGTVTHTAGALTANAVVVGNASADITVLAALGASGTVLTSNGAASPPSFQTASAGALVLLEQHTASSSATLDFTTFISSTYDEYLFEFVNVIPATNTVAFWMRMGTGAGPTYDTGANYGWGSFIWRPGATAVTGVEGGATKIELSYTNHIDNTTTAGVIGSIRLFSPQSTSLWTRTVGQITYLATFRSGVMTEGDYDSTTAVTAVQFLFSSGAIALGTIRCYGVAK